MATSQRTEALSTNSCTKTEDNGSEKSPFMVRLGKESFKIIKVVTGACGYYKTPGHLAADKNMKQLLILECGKLHAKIKRPTRR